MRDIGDDCRCEALMRGSCDSNFNTRVDMNRFIIFSRGGHVSNNGEIGDQANIYVKIIYSIIVECMLKINVKLISMRINEFWSE